MVACIQYCRFVRDKIMHQVKINETYSRCMLTKEL